MIIFSFLAKSFCFKQDYISFNNLYEVVKLQGHRPDGRYVIAVFRKFKKRLNITGYRLIVYLFIDQSFCFKRYYIPLFYFCNHLKSQRFIIYGCYDRAMFRKPETLPKKPIFRQAIAQSKIKIFIIFKLGIIYFLNI